MLKVKHHSKQQKLNNSNSLMENICYLKRHFLHVFIILCLIISASLKAQKRKQLQEKMSKIDQLIYEENDYNAALQICKEVMTTERIDIYYKQKVESIVNLIENYSDYDQKPLKLYFKAREIQSILFKGQNLTKESWEEQGNLYRELLERYPICKLAGFVQYLLARYYKKQIGNKPRYLDKEIAREKVIKTYRDVINKYPIAVFPIHGYPEYFKLGLRIAPIAQINIAWLYESGDHVKPDIEKALKEYQIIIDKYPDAVDDEGMMLALSAYVSILDIYSGMRNKEEFADTSKVKEICRILINNFQNQKYETRGYSFGEIHPEAYMRLAKFEPDKEKAIKLYKDIIEEFPKSWKGKSGSGAIGMYSVKSLNEIINLLDDPLLAIKECHEILNSKLDKLIRGYAQYRIAEIYERDIKDYDRALIEYQNVLDNFSDVNIGGETWTLSDGAESAIRVIQNKLNKE